MSDGGITAALASFETKEEEVDDPLPNVPATRHRPVTVEVVNSSVGDDDDDPTNRYRESSSPEYPYSTSAQVDYSPQRRSVRYVDPRVGAPRDTLRDFRESTTDSMRARSATIESQTKRRRWSAT
jgi:hypothetical protein